MTPPPSKSIHHSEESAETMELNINTISAALEALELPSNVLSRSDSTLLTDTIVTHNGVGDVPMGNLIVAIVFCLRRFGIIEFSNARPNNATLIDPGPTKAIHPSNNRAAERNAVIDALFTEPVAIPAGKSLSIPARAATQAAHGDGTPLTSANVCIFVEDSDDEGSLSYVSDVADDAMVSDVAFELASSVAPASATGAFPTLLANPVAAATVAAAPVAAAPVAAAPVAAAPVAAAPVAAAPVATAHVAAAHVAAAPVAASPVAATHVAAAPIAAAHNAARFCPTCQTQIYSHTPEPYYVVTKGKRVGVFTGWHNVSPLVTGVRGSVYRRCDSEGAAYAAFQEALDAGNVELKGV
ncbi:hypothetical protein JR316_0007623 [Psilocybe cubensis]|uniref:Uncharacterized protein n=1 Tax=Psilocybe cubensis TaxID=181762 RepID=A0ACB8GTT6_PSICU|nr:hypothetical protein JR316_0007623 [Psilocybe cubensis]KAH9479048.1 hypothetical protein JR316_0007623 [Psilocybe cubensis]